MIRVLSEDEILDSIEQELLSGLEELAWAQVKVTAAYASLMQLTRSREYNRIMDEHIARDEAFQRAQAEVLSPGKAGAAPPVPKSRKRRRRGSGG